MVEAVLFDMDGILYDSEGFYMEGTYQLMKSFGYKGDKKSLNCVVGTTMDKTFALLSELLDHKVSPMELRIANDAYYEAHPLNYKDIMFKGIPDVLKEFQQAGIKIACCSSSPLQCIYDSLDAMGIKEYFDFVESGDNLEHPKPSGDIYEMAAKALGVDCSACVVYEDSRIGIEAGKNAGMVVVGRIDTRFEQDQSEADFLVKDEYEMKQIVLKGRML